MRRLNPWLIVLFVLALFLMFSQTSLPGRTTVNYNQFKSLLADNRIESVIVRENNATVRTKDGTTLPVQTPQGVQQRPVQQFTVRLPGSAATPDATLITQLEARNVQYRFEAPSQWLNILLSLLPILLLIGMMYFFFMRAQGGQSGVMQFGQSRAKKYGKENRVQTKFTDVPFFSVSASEFMEMFVGVGASRVRTLFEDARKSAPAIMFIDEIDSIGRKRGAGIGGGHDEREQTLNQILSEMDGFDKASSVIVLGATNRPDVLDPALLRPGRFDRQVTIDLPNLKEREAILKVHLRNKPLGEGVDVPEIAKSTPYFSGADLKNVTNEAALEAARLSKTKIDMSDFYRALDKITLGLENGSLTISPEEKRAIAFHEAGHAVTAAVIPGSDKLQKVSIIPRGRALGAAFYLPEEQVLMSKERLENQLVVSLGGRAAEEVFTGNVTSGAADDFRKATNIARKMVLEWGMGENFKNMALTTDSGPVFLGEDMAKPKAFSEHTSQLVDEDVKRILGRAYERAKSLVTEYSQAMHEVTEALLTQELITGDVVRAAVARMQDSGHPMPNTTA